MKRKILITFLTLIPILGFSKEPNPFLEPTIKATPVSDDHLHREFQQMPVVDEMSKKAQFIRKFVEQQKREKQYFEATHPKLAKFLKDQKNRNAGKIADEAFKKADKAWKEKNSAPEKIKERKKKSGVKKKKTKNRKNKKKSSKKIYRDPVIRDQDIETINKELSANFDRSKIG